MTKEDIVKTAFKVWGRDLYRTTSLSELARELGVSKPALYRHFKDKDALLDAMNTAYFDDSANFIKPGCEKALSAAGQMESMMIMMRTVSEFYIRNKEAFVYSLVKAFNNQDKNTLNKELLSRGIDFIRLAKKEPGPVSYPSETQLIMVTNIYSISQFHLHRKRSSEAPSEDEMEKAIAQIENRILKGLELDPLKVDSLDFQRLEQQAAGPSHNDTENNALLRAVAETVAEAGPWNASMEMVARRSGLSKSGLYAHFKSKQDMLEKLFITEFTRIVDFAKAQIGTSKVVEEQLYLGIISIINYLRARPEILMSMDWVKARQLELGKEMPGRLYGIIKDLKLEVVQNQDLHYLVWIAQWILFLIINTLGWWPSSKDGLPSCPGGSKVWAKNAAEVPNESFRLLFRFISLGLEGLNS